jgi:hypothetical protein
MDERRIGVSVLMIECLIGEVTRISGYNRLIRLILALHNDSNTYLGIFRGKYDFKLE